MNNDNQCNHQELLKLFNLDDKPIETFECHHKGNELHIHVQLSAQEQTCPVCHLKTKRIKGYVKKKITHSVITTEPCYIIYNARRYVCTCGKTFYENNPFTCEGMKISLQTVYKILEDLRNPSTTFTEVAARYNVSPSSAAAFFDAHVDMQRRKLPEYLCLDEVYSFRSEDSNYVCVLVDYISQKVVDLLPSRKKAVLINYFSAIPKEERENVKIVSFDMWETYRIVSKMLFPNSVCAVDKFHIMYEALKKADRVRISHMNELYKEKKKLEKKKKKEELMIDEEYRLNEVKKQYYLIKKFNWVLFSQKDNLLDPNKEKKFNRVMNQYMNLYDIYEYIINNNDELDTVCYLYSQLHNFYRKNTYETAKEQLEELIDMMKSSQIAEMEQLANTMVKWKKEIVNSFIIVDRKINKDGKEYVKKINNGIIENRNKSIKLIKHSSNGYTNWQRFRNRVMYSLNSDSTFRLYPRKKK